MMHAGHRHDARFRARGPAWSSLLLVAVTLVGLISMHQLAGTVGAAGHHAAAGTHTEAADLACEHPGDCPEEPHGHPGQVCQANPGSSTTAEPPHLIQVASAPALPPAVTPSTADHDARDGSGCGPPGRSRLAVWHI